MNITNILIALIVIGLVVMVIGLIVQKRSGAKKSTKD
jgi:hypothetical protein